MTSHYYSYSKGVLHYYKIGNGNKIILCFHGFGMHGRQFKDLEETLGEDFTLISFDLFFHKETRLFDQSIEAIQKGISKKEFSLLIQEFCVFEGISRFSVLGYSMGTHYASVLAEELPNRIDHYILAAPASIRPTHLVRFLSTNWLGNRLLKSLILSKTAVPFLLGSLKRCGILDQKTFSVLMAEVETEALRLDLYANFTYLRFFDTHETRLIESIEKYAIKTYFFFGEYDRNYPVHIGDRFFKKMKPTRIILLPIGHDMINYDFGLSLSYILS